MPVRRLLAAILAVIAVTMSTAERPGGASGSTFGLPSEPRPAGTPAEFALELPYRFVAPGLSASVPSARSVDLESLRADLESAVAGAGDVGRIAVAVTDLQTGETVAVNGDRAQYAGCTANLLGLILVLRDVHEGRYPLETVADLARTTVRYSNPTTARELYRIAGAGDVVGGVQRAVDEVVPLLPVTGVQFDHPPAYPSETIGGWQSNLVTAEALNGLLFALYHGDLVPEPERTFLLEAMDNVYPGLNYLLGVLYGPDGVTVHHKNGFFEWIDGSIDNDSGIVMLTDAGGTPRAFAITFLSEAVPYKYAEVPLGQTLARLAFDHFAGYP